MNLEQIAAQLRKPEGEIGTETALRMNENNRSMYELFFSLYSPSTTIDFLEIGFANGKLIPLFFEKYPGLRFAGLDFSEDMVREAQINASSPAIPDRLKLVLGTSNAMPFADDSFDTVLAVNVIYFWDAPEKHLSEIKRVLKPGGSFFAVFRPAHVMKELPFTAYGFTMYEAEAWSGVLKKAGFDVAGVEQRAEFPFTIGEKEIMLSCVCIEAKWIA